MQQQQIIRPLGNDRFQSYWRGLPGSKLTLDFSPLIEAYGLEGDYCLLHWQARPRGLRRWGIYDSFSGEYTALDAGQLVDSPIRLVQIPEPLEPGGTVPTACVLLPGQRLRRAADDLLYLE